MTRQRVVDAALGIGAGAAILAVVDTTWPHVSAALGFGGAWYPGAIVLTVCLGVYIVVKRK